MRRAPRASEDRAHAEDCHPSPRSFTDRKSEHAGQRQLEADPVGGDGQLAVPRLSRRVRGLLIWTAADAVLGNNEGPSFAGIWPIFATLPTSFLVVLLAGGIGFLLPSYVTLPLFVILLAVAAAINATLLGLLLRWLRKRTSEA